MLEEEPVGGFLLGGGGPVAPVPGRIEAVHRTASIHADREGHEVAVADDGLLEPGLIHHVLMLGGHRHQAHWRAQAIEEARPLLSEYEKHDSGLLDDGVQLGAPSETMDVVEDYRSTGLSLRRHPLALLRHRYPFDRCRSAAELTGLQSGRFVRVAGLVTGRQRPGTASGVLFLTLEDETGNVNVVVWRDRQERFRQALLKGRLLLVKGIMESRDSVIHVIAGEILDHSHALADLTVRARSFR